MGSGASYTKDGVMSQQQLDSALQNGPVVLGVMWTQGGGHAITISGGSGGSYTGHDPEGYPINTNYGGLLTYRAPYGGVGRWKECVRPSGFESNIPSNAVDEAVALPNGLLLDDSTLEQDMARNSEMMREFEEGNYVSTLNVSRPFFQQCDQACSNWCWATGAVMASSAFTSVSCKADEAAVASKEFHAQRVPGSGMMCNWQCNRAGQMENIIDGIQFK